MPSMIRGIRMRIMDNLNNLLILDKFNTACQKENWSEARVLFAFLRIHCPEEAEIILKNMSEKGQNLIVNM